MADAAAVEFLLQNLQQFLTRHINLIKDAEVHVKKLENDLSLFKAFLKDSTMKQRKDAKRQELLRMVRDVVYEAEDIVDAFVLLKSDKGKSISAIRSYFRNAFAKPIELHTIAEVVESVSTKINDIYEKIDRFASLGLGDQDAVEQIEAPRIRKAANIVGFKDEAAKMMKYLKEETHHLDVISIIGMPGLGKTTLAGMVFNHPEMEYEFPIRIWVHVSASFTKKTVFLNILKAFKDNLPEEIYHNEDDEELAKRVSKKLKQGKFLIVMDDVWAPADWEKLEDAFPEEGKVLLTSRDIAVGRYANRKRDPHELRLLTPGESCELLCLEALGKREFPSDLEVLGKNIAKQCGQLPLALVVIGGILAGKYSPSAGMSVVEAAWEKVSKSVKDYLHDDREKRMEKIISLSYNNLPDHLRPCFLYLGMFPEDYEIPAWKLIYLWIAEGFIQPKQNLTLEETAENYLDELINRNLVRSEKVTADGKVKTCRIHDTLRDFCKARAENAQENFLQEMKKSSDGVFQPSSIQKFRRLCIHTYISDFLSSKPCGACVRSFVCFPKDEIQLKNENISEIFTCFKLLRVLDAKPIKFTKLSSDLFKLFHLKYIHLSFKLDNLPPAFSKLVNIQALIVDTTSGTLDIKADVWVMIHLRHFKTKASATLPKPGKGSEGGKQLQTLGTISPQSCTKEAFDRARNLKKLGICGKIAPFLEGKTGSFDSLKKLAELEKLKLLNSADSDGQVYGLPPHYDFPPKLKCLSLSGTCLEWRHMYILGLLENLKVLKLKDRAFTGDSWEAVDSGFRRLEVLYIGRTNLRFWKASAHHFPRLRQLKLHNCGELQGIPEGLADIPTFKLLDLYLSKSAVPSAKKIREAKQENREADLTINAFKLTLFPAEE